MHETASSIRMIAAVSMESRDMNRLYVRMDSVPQLGLHGLKTLSQSMSLLLQAFHSRSASGSAEFVQFFYNAGQLLFESFDVGIHRGPIAFRMELTDGGIQFPDSLAERAELFELFVLIIGALLEKLALPGHVCGSRFRADLRFLQMRRKDRHLRRHALAAFRESSEQLLKVFNVEVGR